MGTTPRLTIPICLTVLAIIAAVAMLPVADPTKGDFALFLNPWMAEISKRGIASIAGDFSAYTPPYIYILNLASLLEPLVGTAAAVKLVNTPFVIGLALGIGRIAGTCAPEKSGLAVAIALVTPTMLINAFAWGQADAIYACFLVWAVYFAMTDRPNACAIMFGLALSFKLQAMFLSPMIAGLVVSRQMPIRAALAIPATYLVMMVPATLAGRPWSDLLTIYVRQTDVMHSLSLNAPNPWWFARAIGVDYQIGVVVGLCTGAVAGVIILAATLRMKRTPFNILLAATACAAIMPYVLPKMTSRYFFVADMLAIGLAFVRPATWPIACVIQLGSLVAYLSYFTDFGSATVAFVPMTYGVALLAAQLRQQSIPA